MPSLNLDTFHIHACDNQHAPYTESVQMVQVTSSGHCTLVKVAMDSSFHSRMEEACETQGESKNVAFVKCHLYWGGICSCFWVIPAPVSGPLSTYLFVTPTKIRWFIKLGFGTIVPMLVCLGLPWWVRRLVYVASPQENIHHLRLKPALCSFLSCCLVSSCDTLQTWSLGIGQ